MFRSSRHLSALLCLFVLPSTFIVFAPEARAQAGLSLTMNQPDGSGDKIAAGRDFATEVLGDPWDMNEITDFNLNESSGLTGTSVSSGVFSATASTADPGIFVLDPGLGGTQRQGRTGLNFPIDTTNYRVLSIRMNVSVASFLQVFWYSDTQGGPFAVADFIATTPGWRVYTVDLATATIVAGTLGSWAGQPARGLRIDPTTVSGSTFQVDWMRLTAPDDAGTTYQASFTPADPGANAAMNFYLDDDATFTNGYIERMATNLREDTATTVNLPMARFAPGNYFVTGRLSRDYASLMLEDPWDMSNAGDVGATAGFSSSSVAGGVFTGTTNSNDPAVQMNVPLSGPNRIDASIYRSLSFQMTLSSASTVQIIWQTSDGMFHATAGFAGAAGSQVYTVNLGSDPTWTGQIPVLRIDPATASGITVTIDWVSVNCGTTALAAAPVTITSASPAPLTVNTPPVAHLLQPDGEGGLDYASFIRNNPWNMAEASDIELTTGMAGGFPQFLLDTTVDGVRGDFLRGQNPAGNGDPAVFFLFNNMVTTIDAARFKNLSFRLNAGPRDLATGSVARVFWQRTAAGTNVQSSEDIIVNTGWNRYIFDLPVILKEPGDPNNDATPWSGTMKYFRIDPHEFPTARQFHIDNVKIAADDEANGRFAITWSATDPDDDATISLYFDTDRMGFNGTLIAGGLKEDSLNNVYSWDTRGVANGTYHVYAEITDGFNTTRRYATGRLTIANATAGDTVRPIGLLESANTVTNTSGIVNVTGWAADVFQVASVQLLVDGTPVARPNTGVFRPTVRDANPSYPDISESGFQFSYNPASLSAGTHSLTVAVFDTAGNRTLLGGAAAGLESAGIYVPANGTWFLKNANSGGAADLAFFFGPTSSTLTAIVGDWDGDGIETIGLYNPANGAFFLRNANANGAADVTFFFGPGGLGWRPVIGDWDGDGIDSIGLYDPTNGAFFLRNANSSGAADLTFFFGPSASTLTPIAADWNGDGVDSIGLYNPAQAVFFLKNTNSNGAADITVFFGPANLRPVVGDWNNDGTDTIGVYDPGVGSWFLKNTSTPGNADLTFFYGPPGATPITGDWNGATP